MQSEVATSYGALRGRTVRGVSAFLGIPYAEPPVQDLRFAPPRRPARWAGERAATAWSASPPQSTDAYVEQLGLGPLGATDEDCLYLNIWTPGVLGPPKPVLVWIPGGAFISGGACTPVYDGAHLAARGDVVVVTLSYRVGLLGFGCLEGAPRNLGLRDQVAALRWVREEIASFGGDPERITVFGESAGAGCIVALLAAPEARGLFRRAIVQSAAPEGMLSAPEGGRRARLLAQRLGLEKLSARALGERSIEELLAAQSRCALEDGPFDYNMLFMPIIDGDFLPLHPMQAIAQGSARDIDLLIGTTEEEMRLYAREPAVRSITREQLELHAERCFGANAGAALATYTRERSARGEDVAPPALFCAVETDRLLREPATRLAASHSERQPATFMYLFTSRSPLFEGALGSCHALDLPFTFGTLDAPRMPEFAGSGPDVATISATMMDAWSGFARRGDPSCEATGDWPAYDRKRRWTLLLGKRCSAVRAPREAERATWDGTRSSP